MPVAPQPDVAKLLALSLLQRHAPDAHLYAVQRGSRCYLAVQMRDGSLQATGTNWARAYHSAKRMLTSLREGGAK